MGNASSASSPRFTTKVWKRVKGDSEFARQAGSDYLVARCFGGLQFQVFVNGACAQLEPVGSNRISVVGQGVELVVEKAGWASAVDEVRLMGNGNPVPELVSVSAPPVSCAVLSLSESGLYQVLVNNQHVVWRSWKDFEDLNTVLGSAPQLHEGGDRVALPIAPTVVLLGKYLEQLCGSVKGLGGNPDCMVFLGFVTCATGMFPLDREFQCKQVHCLGEFSPKPQEFSEILVGASPNRAVVQYIHRLVEAHSLEPTLQFLFEESNVQALLPRADGGDLDGWIQSQVPLLVEVIKTKLASPPDNDEDEMNKASFSLPRLDAPSQVLDRLALKALSVGFAECFQKRFQPWNRLYATFSDGNSFQMMATALEFYPGPTLIVIQTTKGDKLGALSTTRWKEDPKFYCEGGGGALFSLHPTLAIYHRTQSTKPIINVQYLNSRSRTLPLGVGFGGTLHARKQEQGSNCPRLWIDEDFAQCFTSGYDTVYTSGPLLQQGEVAFKIFYLEVWGLGGKDALAERDAMRAQKDRMLTKQKKVANKAAFANNAFDREYLLGGTFNPNAGKESNAQ